MLFGEDDESCAVCGMPFPEIPSDTCTAHWGGPGDVVIVAWTCSRACTDAHQATSAR